MKKMNFLKILMTLVMAFVVTGAFAQINITVKLPDGTPAGGFEIYTISSVDGTVTTIATDGDVGDTDTDATNGIYTDFSPTAETNYLIKHDDAGTITYNSYSPPAVPANVTITLNSNFAETIQEYAANYTADKVTINKDMPFWVYPSPVHNPGWAAPAAADESEIDIADNGNLNSTFVWDYGTDGAAVAFEAPGTATDNYVEINWTSTGVKTITVTETADAAYGGCSGEVKTFFTTVIDIPYLDMANAADATPAYTIGGTGINVILSECESVGTTINPTIANLNTSEEYPYYIGMNYTVHNATIAGVAITLGAAETMPAAVDVDGDVAASTVSATNPLILDGTVKAFDGSNEYPLLAAPTAFPVVNEDITVYRFDLATKGYNAKISRKSDYIAVRDNTQSTLWNSADYTWYTDDNAGANEMYAYIVVLPAPQTGPIYHIPNSWGI